MSNLILLRTIFILLFVILLGKVVDHLYGWIWTRKLTKYFNNKSDSFLDKHFLPIIHSDKQKLILLLDRLGEKSLFSKRYTLLVAAPTVAISLSTLLFEMISTNNKPDILEQSVVAAWIILNVISSSISLWISRKIIFYSKPTLLSNPYFSNRYDYWNWFSWITICDISVYDSSRFFLESSTCKYNINFYSIYI